MHPMPIRIFFALIVFVICYAFPLHATTERRIALVIGNGTYSFGPLKNPVNDATDMAAALRKLGFNVILKKNANLEIMEEAVEDFGNRLKRGGVGLFFYAGHGVQVNGVNYLIPIGAKINKESDVRFKAFDAGRVLAEMENANNGLNILLLDACRDNPFGKSFRSASRGLAIVSNAPTGTFISYSTGPGQVARDGEGRNSPYTKALLQYMQETNVPISNVFMKVRQKLRNETGQVPWELSSLEGDFFFIPQGGRTSTLSNASSVATSSTSHPDSDALLREKKTLERERQELVRQKEEVERQKALDTEREQLAAASHPQTSRKNSQDKELINYNNFVGVWRVGLAGTKLRISIQAGEIVVEIWNSRNGERSKISNVIAEGSNLRFTSYFASANWTINYDCATVNDHEMRCTRSGNTDGVAHWIKE